MFIGQSGKRIVELTVTVERDGELPLFKTWRGSSVKSIRKAAKTHYPGAVLQFGNAVVHYSWGAH